MAAALRKVSTRAFAREHEDDTAKAYHGTVSPSSGASDVDKGDVRIEEPKLLSECKAKGHNLKPVKSVSVNIETFDKLAEEAYDEGYEPMLNLRAYAPQSPLADHRGYVDFAVRLVRDDVWHVQKGCSLCQ